MSRANAVTIAINSNFKFTGPFPAPSYIEKKSNSILLDWFRAPFRQLKMVSFVLPIIKSNMPSFKSRFQIPSFLPSTWTYFDHWAGWWVKEIVSHIYTSHRVPWRWLRIASAVFSSFIYTIIGFKTAAAYQLALLAGHVRGDSVSYIKGRKLQMHIHMNDLEGALKYKDWNVFSAPASKLSHAPAYSFDLASEAHSIACWSNGVGNS